jgi:outer membrane lipoprotein-sorting protein
VRQVRTLTPDGVEKSYTFTTFERGVTIPETRFRFTPPRDVEIYDQ